MDPNALKRVLKKQLTPSPLLIIVLTLVALPIFLLLSSAFSGQPVPGVGKFEFTTRNFEEMVNVPWFTGSFISTLTYAVGKTTLQTAVVVVLAWILVKTNIPFRRLIYAVAMTPILIPATMLAMAIFFTWGPRSGFYNVLGQNFLGIQEPLINSYSMLGMVMFGTFITIPLGTIIMVPAFRMMNPEMDDAARVAGSGTWSSLIRVTFPLISPAILMNVIMGVILGIEATNAGLFLGRPARIHVLAVDVYDAVSSTIPPNYGLATSLAVTILASTVVLLLIYRRVTLMQSRFVTVTGKAPRLRVIDLGRLRYPVSITVLALFAYFILVPVGLSLFEAFRIRGGQYRPDEFNYLTLQHLTSIFQDPLMVRILTDTIFVAVVGALFAVVLGPFIAYIRIRTKWKAGGLLYQLGLFPLAIPGIVVSLAVLWTMAGTPIYGSPWAVVFAFTITGLPYGVSLLTGTMYQIGHELEESSRVAGASWFASFRSVILPLLSPSIFGAVMYLTARNIAALETVLLLRGPGLEVLATKLWTEWQQGLYSVGSAINVTMFTLVAVLWLSSKAIESRVGFKLEKAL